MVTTPERYAFFRLDTISIRYLAFLFDMIRYVGLKKDLLFKEFSANFQNFRRIFGIFGVVVVVVVVEDFGSWVFRNFRGIF